MHDFCVIFRFVTALEINDNRFSVGNKTLRVCVSANNCYRSKIVSSRLRQISETHAPASVWLKSAHGCANRVYFICYAMQSLINKNVKCGIYYVRACVIWFSSLQIIDFECNNFVSICPNFINAPHSIECIHSNRFFTYM